MERQRAVWRRRIKPGQKFMATSHQVEYSTGDRKGKGSFTEDVCCKMLVPEVLSKAQGRRLQLEEKDTRKKLLIGNTSVTSAPGAIP